MFMKQLLLIVIKGKFQVKYWNVINFPSMWWIQIKQGSKRWLESLHLCLDSSRSCKRNKKSFNLALCRKQATLVYWVIKRSLLLKTIFSRKQLQRLKNLSKNMNIRRFHLLQRKDTSNRKDKCNLWNVNRNERFMNTFCVPVIYKHSP